jgi:hypothetical protein
MAECPFHSGPICSLCCTLEKTCDDMCKAKAEGPAQKILAGYPEGIFSVDRDLTSVVGRGCTTTTNGELVPCPLI